ncbi:alpha/beta hydrolase [Nocardia sp. CDC159]|uniref:Alpha/beta hydrolase n=1 Tax=Nocardia pulmonis TaxID=2951408 RepID=A0A9X2IWR3_9NOCA|nr:MULTISPECIES: alpha/beta hydrolase [Nocardia]MCM6774623.1 alpha/beta hydrolase [Nocardia pulmonis]MCM6787312.1 alpha/beta hydrolase [Nocardia sp. CDC159]
MEFEEIVVETDRLNFPALAAGDGPVVVCWHGFPDHPATFGPLAERLVAAGRRVVAPFLRGHHPATATELTYAGGITLAADAAAVAAALDPAGVDMIGHDIGAGAVARVAAAWPERLRRGITMAVPPPATLPALLTDPAQLQRFFYIWLFQVPAVAEQILTANRDLIDYLWSTWSPGLDPGDHRIRIHRLYGDPTLLANALRIYRANFDPALHDPTLAHLAPKTEAPAPIPLLALAGANDGCIPPSAYATATSGLAPGSRLEIIDAAGHFIHLDQPDAVAELALEWFDTLSRASS